MGNLFTHECHRIFEDRLINAEDREQLRNVVDKAMEQHMQMRFKDFAKTKFDCFFAKVEYKPDGTLQADPADPQKCPYNLVTDRALLKQVRDRTTT